MSELAPDTFLFIQRLPCLPFSLPVWPCFHEEVGFFSLVLITEAGNQVQCGDPGCADVSISKKASFEANVGKAKANTALFSSFVFPKLRSCSDHYAQFIPPPLHTLVQAHTSSHISVYGGSCSCSA